MRRPTTIVSPGRDAVPPAVVSGLIILLIWASPALARTWHVAQKEIPQIDSGDQVRTIGEAVSRVEPGDTIILHGGVYREGVQIDKSGSEDKPIIFRAAEGEQVVLTGADHLTDWTEVPGEDHVYVADWRHRFITWNKHNTHPGDEFHRLIGRCEQVFINAYPLRQVLARDKLARGTFWVDLDAKRLYIHPANDRDLTGNKARVEASARDRILSIKGDHVSVKGLRFRYAANRAQQGAVELAGNYLSVADCVFEYTNSSEAEFTGEDITVRNCTFQHNGQLGFGASRAHRLHLTGCTVRNCLIASNENAGIFYEISYGLHAHDNVIIGNGFAFSPGAWGASSGISLSSSPGCVIERNLLIGNKEGFNFREQTRSTPKIDGGSEPVWNHDQVVRRNILAFNRDAQVWGWFDIADERHWPRTMQANGQNLSLDDLHLTFENNLYCPGPGQGLFHWGVTWKKHKKYDDLSDVQEELSLAQGSKIEAFSVRDDSAFDFRVPADSPAVRMGCYPRGSVPGVQLGALR